MKTHFFILKKHKRIKEKEKEISHMLQRLGKGIFMYDGKRKLKEYFVPSHHISWQKLHWALALTLSDETYSDVEIPIYCVIPNCSWKFDWTTLKQTQIWNNISFQNYCLNWKIDSRSVLNIINISNKSVSYHSNFQFGVGKIPVSEKIRWVLHEKPKLAAYL